MDYNNTSMPKFVLMNSLSIYQGLIEKSPHRRGLIEPDHAVIRTNFLERA